MYIHGSATSALTVRHLDQSTHVHPSCSSGYPEGVLADWCQRRGAGRIAVPVQHKINGKEQRLRSETYTMHLNDGPFLQPCGWTVWSHQHPEV